MWGERGLISHKFEGAGEGGAGVCTEGRPRSCARVHGAAGCEPGVQLAVAWWARLAAGRVHYGRAAGGCPMGQAGSWVGVLWACSWRLPDGPGWQLGVHYGHAAGGCPMGQAGSWGCTMGVQLAVARWARLAAGGVLWAYSWRLPDGPGWQLGVHYGHAMAIPARCRGCRTQMLDMQTRSVSHTKFMVMASDFAQIIYIYIQISYKHSVIYAHIQGIICHMIFFEDHHGGRARGHINIRYNRGSSDICEWAWQKGAGPHFGCHAISSKTSHTSSVYTD